MPQWNLQEWQAQEEKELEKQAIVHSGKSGLNHVTTSNRVCHVW